MAQTNIVTHPLVSAKLAIMREKSTDSATFRSLANQLAEFLCYEASREFIDFNNNIALVSVLRAGNGMLDGALRLVPLAPVGHIGLYRDPKTAAVIEYYLKLPSKISQMHVFLLDPMIATGHSAAAAVSRVKEFGAKSISFISLVAAPEGIDYLQQQHKDIAISLAALDQGLDARNYIVPGLGDAGDRIFGTS